MTKGTRAGQGRAFETPSEEEEKLELLWGRGKGRLIS